MEDKELIEKYQQEIYELEQTLEEIAEPLESEIKHNNFLIRKIQQNCEHVWDKGKYTGYHSEMNYVCTICGYSFTR